MAAEERLSILSDWNCSRQEIQLLNEKFVLKQLEYNKKTAKLESALRKEKHAHASSVKEAQMYKDRLITVLKSLKSLGLDVGSVTPSTAEIEGNHNMTAKTLVYLEISPANTEVDLQMVWNEIKSNFHIDGLTWGEKYKLESLGYGICNLEMTCTIVDSMVSIDDITDAIESLDEFVQSVRVLSMNKI
jgi:translation elongation factor EF-1beta